ncbi:MAG: sigma-70 family RNA polymerase sigma factor [Myxococcota bacterium]|nr:sigma-70 family RNA polymerase sigma factor [Myxococcota bacterium]
MVEVDGDAELMLQVGGGDRRAFAALFDRHSPGVTRFAYRFVGDRARAEELAQDIFVKLFQGAREYRPTARFKTYLYRVASNHCLNELRRQEYRVTHTTPEEEAAHADPPQLRAEGGPEQDLDGRELERTVQRAMAKLSDRERAAFCMCRFEGMAYREIALALEASEAAIKSLIHRATLAVAQQLQSLSPGSSPVGSKG